MSTSTSPALSAPPSTPLGYKDNTVRVVSHSGSGLVGSPRSLDATESPNAPHHHHPHLPSPAYASSRGAPAPAAAKKGKPSDVYARASPCVW